MTRRFDPHRLYGAVRSALPSQEHGVHLFFLHDGVMMVNTPLRDLPVVQKTLCDYSRRQMTGNEHHDQVSCPTVTVGGLMNLGTMISASDYCLTLPNTCGEARPFHSPTSHKRLAIILDRKTTSRHATEGVRLAVGLAGTGHAVTLLAPIQEPTTTSPLVALTARPYLDLFSQLGGEYVTGKRAYALQTDGRFDAILEV
ncbi:MAG: hypothetical protein HQL50_00305 [Magnetococcales bacterium]|nr:hypothetical protein [Magnetococcales bacterium]